ncbi:hypothetical protein HMPREF9997_00882 [Corynebacterium durum F0235]|uniref:Uncharacterized protein n=1 Tax=Corynebacterium durum F0235 TaxID=1035195 RepID=L1MIY5_9CORY|nr:hypothetical protein HMPREF9997_00882 [Corynebacterium durum F0235]
MLFFQFLWFHKQYIVNVVLGWKQMVKKLIHRRCSTGIRRMLE